jgi:nicotinamide riboside kinase
MSAKKILVLGDPGTGKSTAAETLDPKITFYISSDCKELPFKGWKNNYKTVKKDNGKIDLQNTNYYTTDNPQVILSLIRAISDSKPETKVIVLDTITAIMENEYMPRIKEKGFEKFNDTALSVYQLLKIADELRNDLTVIVLGHTETSIDDEGVRKTSFKVIGGKLIGEKIVPEARFDLVLFTEVQRTEEDSKYFFLTQNNGKNTCRTPKGMFDQSLIPNDYNYVLQKMQEYEQ